MDSYHDLTTGIHRLSLSSYSYSPPSSVSSRYLLDSLEKDIRGSSSKDEGDLGKDANRPSSPCMSSRSAMVGSVRIQFDGGAVQERSDCLYLIRR